MWLLMINHGNHGMCYISYLIGPTSGATHLDYVLYYTSYLIGPTSGDAYAVAKLNTMK